MQIIKYLSLISLVALTSCKPPKSNDKKDQPIPSSGVSLNTSFTNCEDKLRSYLKDQSFKFVNVKSLESEINAANQDFGSEDAASTMSFSELNKQITSYTHSTQYAFDGRYVSKNTTIGLNEKKSANPMYFLVSVESRDDKSVVKLNQKFTISTQKSDCKPELSKTLIQKYTKLSETNYHFSMIEVGYDDSVIEQDEQDFKIDSGFVLNEFSNISKLATVNEDNLKEISTVVTFDRKLGIMKSKIEALEDSKDSVFGINLNLKNINYKVLNSKNEELLSVLIGLDSNNSIFVSKQGQLLSWNGPYSKFFDLVYLGQAQNSNSNYYSSTLSSEYQGSHDTFVFKTIKGLTYDNFKAYFEILNQSTTSDQKTTYVLKEKSDPVIDSLTTPLDLESNDTIQTNLPEIQKIANQIANTFKNDREGQIRAVLEYLSSNYQYDQEMADRNVIRPLTTQEALDRKKGVCQHYAVLFTAITRALKIPSRIIIGFFVNAESLGFHAWNEVEITKNKWQVVEPQSRYSLDNMQTRYYFPLLRGASLENKKVDSDKDLTSILLNNFFGFEKYEEK